MSLFPRLLLFAALGWLAFILFQEAQAVNAAPDGDPSKIVLLFGAVVLVGGLAGVLFVIMVMPSIGDAIGNFFFQPNQTSTPDPHAHAQSAMARGDYAEAIEEYQKAIGHEPDDLLAYSEIAKIYCDHLGDSAAAAETLEEAMQREWAPDDAAFLTSRLAEIYWRHQHDAARARELLQQLIDVLPGTRHAANAQHRLHEIEQQRLGG
jgi:tetratricopeptide (TPR) repeat protein